jgi:glutathione S-transferase
VTTLYIANKNYSSWSLRPWVLMTQLGIEFDEQLMVFGEGSNWEAFRAFSPNGRVPCLHDGDAVVWDSLAIMEYLAERHPGVWPSNRDARTWARCAAAEMHSGFGTLRNVCGMSCGLRVRLHEVSSDLKADIARIHELWNEGLSRFGGPFLAGDAFTAVDAFYAPVVFRIQTHGLPIGGAASGYVDRMLALPAMRDWYAAALAEPWRDHAHEAETRQYGEVVEDFRVA